MAESTIAVEDPELGHTLSQTDEQTSFSQADAPPVNVAVDTATETNENNVSIMLSVSKIIIEIERKKHMHRLGARYFEMRYFFFSFCPVVTMTLGSTILSLYGEDFTMWIGILSAASVFIQAFSSQTDFNSRAQLQTGAAANLEKLNTTMFLDLMSGEKPSAEAIQGYRDQFDLVTAGVGQVPMQIENAFSRVEQVMKSFILKEKLNSGMHAVQEVEVMEVIFRYTFDYFCNYGSFWPLFIRKDVTGIDDMVDGSGRCHAALERFREVAFYQPNKSQDALRDKAMRLAVRVEKLKFMHRLASRYYEMKHFIFMFIPVILMTLAVAILTLFEGNTSALAIGIISATSVSMQAITAQTDFDAKAKLHNAASNSLEKVFATISFDISDRRTYDQSKYQHSRETFHQALSNVKLVPILIENAFAMVDTTVMMEMSGLGLDSNDKYDATRMAFQSLFNLCCCEMKSWPLHIFVPTGAPTWCCGAWKDQNYVERVKKDLKKHLLYHQVEAAASVTAEGDVES